MTVTTPKLEAGAFITPNVKLLHPLAEGGMGRVWVAEHLGLNTKVVVKMMADVMLVRDDGAERFAREAAAAAAIKSPHVCQVFDHGLAKVPRRVWEPGKGSDETDESVPYIVMELLEGKDLGAYLAEHPGPMDPLDVVAIVTQVGKALIRAHKAGIVHRDIKPDNIFLCETDDHSIFVKLLDFGTAKKEGVTERKDKDGGEAQTLVGPPPTGRTTVPGQIMGTPYYMSPEQSVGGEIDERSDIWSLGVVAFEALTGQKPFDGASIGAIAIAIHGKLPKITDYVPGLPTAVDEWFERACAQAPADRFQNVRDAMSAFVLAVTGNALTFDPPTESVHFPHPGLMRTPSPSPGSPMSISTRPQPLVHHEPLIASLPERGSEKRPTMIAAGIVVAIAGIAMAAIVLSRSPSSSSLTPAESQGIVATSAEMPAAPTPAPSPSPMQTVVPPPAEPEPAAAPAAPTTPAKLAKHGAPPAAKPAAAPPAPSPSAAPLKRTNGPSTPAAPSSAATPTKPAPAGPDDDLAALSRAASKHSAEAPPSSPPPPSPPPPSPQPSAPAPSAPAPAPLPNLPPE